MKVSNLSGSVVLSIVLGLIVGFALGVLWQNSAVSENSNEEEVTLGDINLSEEFESFTELEVVSGSGSISVKDQKDGDFVLVSKIDIENDGWVAVREDSDNGFGNILGALFVEAGSHSDVQVPLLRGTEAGNKYYVVLFADNGDRLFNHTVDPIIQKDGEVVVSSMVAN